MEVEQSLSESIIAAYRQTFLYYLRNVFFVIIFLQYQAFCDKSKIIGIRMLMSKAARSSQFSGEMDKYYDANFAVDISEKMRVPKRIKVDGTGTNEISNGGNSWNNMLSNEKFEMHVPERILVMGQDQHMGTKAPPRELVLENAVMPPDPGMIRVQTPPRVITLSEHHFPSEDYHSQPRQQEMVARGKPRSVSEVEHRLVARDSTPPIGGGGEGLTPSEEVMHLRKQLAKLNRRVMAIELDTLQRQQREKIMYGIGLAYFLIKALLWLGKSS